MKTTGKRVLSVLLTLCLIVGLLPALSLEVEATDANDIIEFACKQENKTWADLGNLIYSAKKSFSDPGNWCGNFVWWCAYEKGLVDTGLFPSDCYFNYAIEAGFWFSGGGSGKVYLYDDYYYTIQNRGDGYLWQERINNNRVEKITYTFQPQKGDIILYGYNAMGSAVISHTGFVRENSVKDSNGHYSSIETIQGNYASKVSAVKHSIKNSYWDSENSVWASVVGFARPLYCSNHTYNKYGVCTNCGAKVDFSQYTGNKTVTLAGRDPATWAPGYTAMSGKYTPNSNKSAEIWDAPYDKSMSNPPLLKPGDTIEVTGKFWNGVNSVANHTWYTVKYGNEIKYMYSGKLKEYSAPPPESSLTISPNSRSITIDPNGSGWIGGAITSNYPIVVVSATINNGNTFFYYQINNPKPTDTGLDLSKTSINDDLRDEIKRRNYSEGTIQIWAQDTSGKTKPPAEVQFTVKQNSLKAPEIKPDRSDYGAVYYSISNPNNRGTLSYSYAGVSGNGAATVKITENTTITATVSDAGYSSSDSVKVSRSRTAQPKINIVPGPSGATFTLNHSDSKARLWYQIGDSAARIYSARSNGGKIPLSTSCTVYAWAEKSGEWISDIVSADYRAEPPGAPQVRLVGTEADIPQGRQFTVGWNKDVAVSDYTLNIYRDGILDRTEAVYGSQTAQSIKTGDAGKYTVSMVANNAFGSSPVSNTINVTAHAPVTVTVKTDDGTIIEEPKTIEWGSDLETPSVPAKRGYTFTGWSREFTNFTEDTIVIAKYQINTYTVTFYDVDGKRLLGTQRIQFEQSINSEEMESELHLPAGYAFAGWHISQCDPSSLQNLAKIDCNMSLVATKLWTAPGSVVVSIESAARNANSDGYDINVLLSSPEKEKLKKEYQKVKIIATIETEEGQMLGAEIVTKSLTATDFLDDPYTPERVPMFISYGKKDEGKSYIAACVRVSVVGVDGNDHTGGLLGKEASIRPTVITKYSAWMTEEQLTAAGKSPTDGDVVSKTQYQYNDKKRLTTTRSNTTGSAPSVSGYALIDTSSEFPTWPSNLQWSDSYIAKTSKRDVQTRQVVDVAAHTEYRYGRWTDGINNSYCRSMGVYFNDSAYSQWHEEYTGWMKSPYVVQNYWYCYGHVGTSDHSHAIYNSGTGADNWSGYYPSGASVIEANRWFWEETKNVPTTYRTQYAYRDKVYTYTYQKWVESGWSDWSDTVYVSSMNSDFERQVNQRTLYCYITSDTREDSIPSTGSKQSCSGTLDLADKDLVGKYATVLVYKETNSDPTEPQLEYVGETMIGAGNSFSFDYWTKEEPDASTGDFVVALAIEGASNVVNVGKRQVFREYTVTFYDENENVVDEQTGILPGSSAEMVAAPDIPGQYFVRWDRDFSYVTSNMEIRPIYWPKQYSVVFVDYENATTNLKTDYRYNNILLTPETPTAAGMTFAGWDIISNDTGLTMGVLETDTTEEYLVTEDLLVVAQWEPEEFTVTFMDAKGDILEEQQVSYEMPADLPELTDIPDGMVFLGWSTENAWWKVTEPMIVRPIITYLENTQAPISSIGSEATGTYERLELSASDDAVIYYTLDGSAPNPERVISEDTLAEETSGQVTYRYENAIELSETTIVRTMSRAEGKNDSEIVDVVFYYNDFAEGKASQEDFVQIGTYNLIAKPGQKTTLYFSMADNPGIASYEFAINADSSVFDVVYDEETLAPIASEGEVCEGKGNVFVGDYQQGSGWQVFWFGSVAAKEDGVLCSIQLQARDDIELGVYPVTVSYSPANTFTEEYLEHSLTDNFTVGMGGDIGLRGDVNGDGVISSIDVVRIARYIVKDLELTDEQAAAADVTGDGHVTASDVIRLARYLVGLAELLVPDPAYNEG